MLLKYLHYKRSHILFYTCVIRFGWRVSAKSRNKLLKIRNHVQNFKTCRNLLGPIAKIQAGTICKTQETKQQNLTGNQGTHSYGFMGNQWNQGIPCKNYKGDCPINSCGLANTESSIAAFISGIRRPNGFQWYVLSRCPSCLRSVRHSQ